MIVGNNDKRIPPVLADEPAPPGRTHGTLATPAQLAEQHQHLLAAATADNTRRTYRSAIRHFQAWGGVLPCDEAAVIRYLLSFAQTLNPRTLALRLTALAQWHRYQGFLDPTASATVRKTLRGIERVHGRPRQKAKALLLEDLERVVSYLDGLDGLAARRDSALLQMGFFGAFRRSELVALEVSYLQWEREGLLILLPRSKTDQAGEGLNKAIPYGDSLCCPAKALRRWLDAAQIEQGPLFRRISRWGLVGEAALHEGSVNSILTSRAREAGLLHDLEMSSHSRGLGSNGTVRPEVV